MINPDQFRKYVIQECLGPLDLWSPQAEELLIGTAAQESLLGTYIHQLGDGPALGVFQMEPATYHDIWDNFLRYRESLVDKITPAIINRNPERMVTDMKHAVVMARLHYYRVPEPLPSSEDLDGQAQYWKKHYNTPLGAGTKEEYIENYHRCIK